MRIALPLVILGLLVLLVSSCGEAEPAEISVRCKLNGRPQGATVEVWNAKGVQITEEHGDNNGVAYIKSLPPGTYTLKFKDAKGQMYPAQISISVSSNDSQMREVELSDEAGGLGGGTEGEATT